MFSLDGILKATRERIKKAEFSLPIAGFKEKIKKGSLPIRSFQKAITASKKIALIGEIKKASPSAGLIRENFSPQELAQSYERNGAAAISVLTEEKFFQGKLDYLLQIKNEVSLPLLRKDFIVDEYQIWESRFFGADAILLIVSILKDEQIKRFLTLAQKLNMDALVEIHRQEEWERISKLPIKLVGINNRSLKTLEIDLNTSYRLLPLIPKECIVIGESGIKTREDVLNLEKAGIRGILVGESIMRSEDAAQRIRYLLGE